LSKDFEKVNDKLIIQYFYHIHICTLTYMIYSSNFSILKNTEYLSTHTKIWNKHVHA